MLDVNAANDTPIEQCIERLQPVGAELYKFAEIDASEIKNHPDAIRQVCENDIHGLIITNVFSPEELQKVSEQLTRVGPLPDSDFGDILIYGPALYVAESNMERYRSEAVEFREFCRQLFSGGKDFETQIENVLGQMSDKRGVEIPNAPDGQPYSPTTIRVLEQGQDMGWHFENQFLHCTSGYKHLSTLIEHDDHLSYFVTLEAPEEGGELVLYDMQWHETEWLDKEVGGVRRWGTVDGKPIGEVMEQRRKMTLKAPVGSMVLFDGGRILHRVSKVKSPQRRVTVGGFTAFSKQRETVYYWS